MSKRAGWVKYCLGCAVIAVLVGGIAAYLGYRWASDAIGKTFSLDPVKVAARAAELVPGAAPPAGYEGKMLMDLGDELTVTAFGAKKKGDQTMLMLMVVSSKGKSHAQIEQEAMNSLQKSNKEQGRTEVLSSKTVELTIGNATVNGFERDVRRKGAEELQYTALASKPGDDRHLVLIFCQGPKQGFDRTAMDEFLSKLKVTPISLESAGSPTPEETPAETETPAES